MRALAAAGGVVSIGHRPAEVADAVSTGATSGTHLRNAMAPLPFGKHPLGGTTVVVGPGGVRTADGTLAGSHLSAVEAVRNLVSFTGCAPHDAAVSRNPSRLLRRTDIGLVAAGRRADLVVLTPAREVRATIAGGEAVFGALPGA
jgi:N-acetylglucosamine-6-phosphate deacetylase